MSEERILVALARIGAGVTEIYSHPGAIGDELSALVSPRVCAAVTDSGLRTASFGELPTGPQEGGKYGATG